MTKTLLPLLVFSAAVGCSASAKPDVEVDIGGTSDVSADGFGPYRGATEQCNGGVPGQFSARAPYHFYSFETDGCDETRIEALATDDESDLYLLFYAFDEMTGRWMQIASNDDCRDGLGRYDSCLDLSLDAGEYLVGVTTFEYASSRDPLEGAYDLHITCRTPGACGPIVHPDTCEDDMDCSGGMICDRAGAVCGGSGVCEFPRDILCEATPDPVCGCDGISYMNDCERRSNYVGLASMGECGAARACGGRLGLGACEADEYCDFAVEAMCGSADQLGVCTARPTACDDGTSVCGCDGETYSSACDAASNGTSVASLGQCGPEAELCQSDDECSGSFVCDKSASTCGGAGECVLPQDILCESTPDPVCGCDGVTYMNDCERRVSRVALAHTGSC